MGNIFYKLYSMSLTASLCVLMICIIRQFIKKAPKIYSYLLWSIVAFRLICPFSLESSISLFNHLSFHAAAKPAVSAERFINPQIPEQETPDTHEPAPVTLAAQEQHPAAPVLPKHIILSALPYVWLIGVVLLLLYSLLQYQRLNKRLHNTAYRKTLCYAGNKTIPVWEGASLSTAFILGVFRIRIFLPAYLQEAERNFCLAHELTHIRRKDYLIKQFAYLLRCIYWFNPVIWLAYFLMTKDMEMSCDEAVLGKGELNTRKEYSNTLLNLAAPHSRFGGSPLAFGENNIKPRIKNIMNYRKPAFWVSTLCFICVGFLATAMVTNAKSMQPLSKAELEHYTEYLNLPENNGFIKDRYYDPKQIYWDIVLYDGANLQNKLCSEKEIQDYYTYIGKNPDLNSFQNVHPFTGGQIKAFVKEKTGISYDVMKYKLHWVYLSEYDTYYSFNKGSSLYTEVKCVKGCIDKENGFLMLEYRSIWDEQLQGNVTLTFDPANPEQLYFFKNVTNDV